jgi:hypothetical protein
MKPSVGIFFLPSWFPYSKTSASTAAEEILTQRCKAAKTQGKYRLFFALLPARALNQIDR